LVAGDGDLHRRRGKEEEKKLSQTPPVVVARGGTRRHCSSTVQAVPEAFLCNSWSFRVYFVNFKLLM